MRIKKYPNLPNCNPIRLPYTDKFDEMATLLNEIENPEKILDGIILKLKKIQNDQCHNKSV